MNSENDLDINIEQVSKINETDIPDAIEASDSEMSADTDINAAEEHQTFSSFRDFIDSIKAEDDAVAESVPESEDTPEVDYKSELIRLKADYKTMKRAQRLAKEEAREEKRKRGYRPGLTILVSVLASFICFLLLFAFCYMFPTRDSSLFATIAKRYGRDTRNNNYYGTASDPSKIDNNEIPSGSDVTINIEGEFSASAAYAKASPSVVAIVTAGLTSGVDGTVSETRIAQGAGVVISKDGEILTNHHVISSVIDTKTGGIAKGYKIYIYFDDPRTRPYEVESIIGYDSEFDLALIKINRTDLVPIEFFDSDDLTIGESVIAIGSPGGIEFMNSVCDGIVSGLKRTVTSSESGATLYDMIQITAPINPGNSGGAVVNSKGQLVGISVIKIVAENYENMAFAISSDTASRLIQSFRKYGKYVKPLLGVTINTLYGWKEADEYGWPLGCQVVAVSEGSGAEKAGIREGDIICLINGKDTPDYTSLRTYLLKFAPGDEVTFNVFRPADNKYYELKITLTAA